MRRYVFVFLDFMNINHHFLANVAVRHKAGTTTLDKPSAHISRLKILFQHAAAFFKYLVRRFQSKSHVLRCNTHICQRSLISGERPAHLPPSKTIYSPSKQSKLATGLDTKKPQLKI